MNRLPALLLVAISACRGEISPPLGAGARNGQPALGDAGLGPPDLAFLLDAGGEALADAEARGLDGGAASDVEAPDLGEASTDAMASVVDSGEPADGAAGADGGDSADAGALADSGAFEDGGTADSGAADGNGTLADSGGPLVDSGPEADAGILNYNPCPAVGPCRYMPLGDSVTEGYEGGYRIPLFRSALADQLSITFVGGRANGPATVDGVPFPREHEGHGGFYIDRSHSNDNIADLVVAALAAHSPHIIALMIGANDVARAHMPDSSARLALLLDRIITAAPDALIVLAQITPAQSDEDNGFVEAYNRDLPALVTARQALGKHIILVDMYSAFTAHPDYKTSLMYDNLHPGPAGDEVMASVWYAAIRGYLPR